MEPFQKKKIIPGTNKHTNLFIVEGVKSFNEVITSDYQIEFTVISEETFRSYYSDKKIVIQIPYGVSSRLYLRKIYEHAKIFIENKLYIRALFYIPKRLFKDYIILKLWVMIKKWT